MVEFIEETHQYLNDGIIIPSVSKILRPITNQIYTDDIPSYILERAAAKGTAVHYAIECYEENREFEIKENYNDYFLQYLKAKKEIGFRVLENEIMVDFEYYAGRIDQVIEIDGKKCLLDLKTTSKLHDKLVLLQLTLYKIAYEYTHKEKIHDIYVLNLQKDKYIFKKLEALEL